MRLALLCAVSMTAVFSARADYAPEFGNEAAYKVNRISASEYENDTTGNVFKDYQVGSDGTLEPLYYRYEINGDKAYNETVTKTGSGAGAAPDGAGDDKNEFYAGVGLNNSSATGGSVDNVLYKDNTYNFDYTGDGADVKVFGGVVYNSGTMEDINADFVGNSFVTQNEEGKNVHLYGAALANKGVIGSVHGDFVNNKAEGTIVEGGVVYGGKGSRIDGIQGDFIGNKAIGETVKGAAIDNNGNLFSLSGNMVGNVVETTYLGQGGVISNEAFGVISKIDGDFIGNSIQGGTYNYGGAIANMNGAIGVITGDFINNSLATSETATDTTARGGAISHWGGTISGIKGNFYGNTIKTNNDAFGGALHVHSWFSDATVGGIEGDFVQNSATATDTANGEAIGGAIYSEKGQVGPITGNFVQNEVSGTYARGGAIFQTEGAALGAIDGDFVENKATGVYVYGGAIDNEESAIEKIEGSFSGNQIQASAFASGGAIANMDSYIGVITGDFNNNSVVMDKNNAGAEASGGAIAHWGGTMSGVVGNFKNNSVESVVKADGGAIYIVNALSDATMGDLNGNFERNSVTATDTANGEARGGAIYNEGAKIGLITGNFDGNEAISGLHAQGGAIFQDADSEIAGIKGDFRQNRATGNNASGGAVYNNHATIARIVGDFEGNTAQGESLAKGGAIYNASGNLAVSGDFSDNRAVAGTGNAFGGAVYGYNGTTGNSLNFVNSNFYNNAAVAANGEARGGAIYANNLSITADGQNSEFRGNTANGVNNAIYMGNELGDVGTDEYALNLNTINNGNIVFDDGIDGDLLAGQGFDLNLKSDGTGEVVFNNTVNNVNNFNLAANTAFHLGKDAVVNTHNYTAEGNNTLTLDMAIDEDAERKIQNGILNVSGDVKGDTGVIVKPVNNGELDEPYGKSSVFVKAPNDDMTTDSSFNVIRYEGSPYEWEAIRNYQGETEGSTWHLALKGVPNPDEKPDPDKNLVEPEIVGYTALPSAAVEQNRSISQSVGEGIQANLYKGCCGSKRNRGRRRVYRHNMWVNADFSNAEIDAPAHMDADIKGVTAGIDVAGNLYHRFGAFGSYRHGDYDLSGKGKLNSSTGSELDIDSYLGGLYYRYGRQRWVILATLFAGTQDINLKTDDKVVSTSTDAMQYGGSLEFARKFYLPHAWIIEPSLGLYYTAVDMDPIKDTYRKEAEFDLMHYMEAELGLRIEKAFCMNGNTSEVYIKPSIIQTYTKGGDARITGLSSVDTAENQTLGKIAVGAHLGLTKALSAYTSVNYVFGADYKAYGIDAGLTYSW